MSASIRPAIPADDPALVEQFLELNRHEDRISGDRRTDRKGARLALEAARQSVSQSNGAALVAEIDGGIVGHLFLVFRDDAVFVREEMRRHGYVTELYVRPEARRRGIASALLAEAERLTRARGVTRLLVGVLAGNSLAEDLYARHGFTPYTIELAKVLA